MTNLVERISSYYLFNYLFTGIVFVIFASRFTPYSFIQNDLLIAVFLYYFIGLVISRIGSLVVEPLLKGAVFVKFESYSSYLTALKKDPNIEVLSEANNMYRTLATVFAALLTLKLYALFETRFPSIATGEIYVLLAAMLLIFLFAYKKQTEYLVKRIKKSTEHE